MNNLPRPQLIEGEVAVDDRGQITFANGFNFAGIKRFYVVENFSNATVRAWHGHLKEAKYVLAVSGSAIVAVVEMDDPHRPNPSNDIQRFILSARRPSILYIPAGYANGFRALELGTKLIFFSTASLEESQGDDYRFGVNYWGDKVWLVENR